MARPKALLGGITTAKLLKIINPKTWWTMLGLDLRTLLAIMKAALPPTLVIALSQSGPVLHATATTLHVAALMAIISHVLMPRGKFVKIMFFNVLALCIALSVSCLALVCSVKAGSKRGRLHAPNTVSNGYNSDANTVAAIWLILTIWVANALRSWRPVELQNPVIAFSTFTTFNVTHFGNFFTVRAGIHFMLKLFESMLLGFAIASVISLFILPLTSRDNFFQGSRDFALQIESVLQEQAAFVRDTADNTAVWFAHGNLRRAQRMRNRPNDGEPVVDEMNLPPGLHPAKQKVQKTMAGLDSLFTRLQYDLLYSRNEIAIGKLRTEDLERIEELLGSILLPISGISMLPGILEMHIKHERHQQMKMMADDPDEEILTKQSELQKAVNTLQKHLSETAVLATTGIQYFLLVTELMTPQEFQKQRKPDAAATIPADEEESGDFFLNPLDPYFVVRFERMMHQIFQRRRHFLSSIAFSEVDKDSGNTITRNLMTSDSKIRLEFFLILHMGHMQDVLLHATHELLKFADIKVADGTMKSYRPIFPQNYSIKQWLSLLKPANGKSQDQDFISRASTYTSDIGQREEETRLPDSEHLPPSNMWEKGSNVLRLIIRVITSEHSVFGFRVAAASFCIGIVAFLRNTQQFFFHLRCVWVMIVIVLGMNPTSGETFFGFTGRILGTAVSMVLSMVIWYIVDQKSAGIIVFLYMANMIEYYFYVKYPQLLDPCVIAITALNDNIATALEERKVGGEQPESSGVQEQPIYIFAPYKLAAVAVACVFMLFWTLLPYASTAKSRVRGMVGHSLFILAQFYSVTHMSTALWMSTGLSDGIRNRQALSDRLVTKIRKIFRKEMVLLDELRNHIWFTRFEPPVGGKFPRRIYDDITTEIQNALSSMSLMVKTTQSLEKLSPFPMPSPSASISTNRSSASPERETEKQEKGINEEQQQEQMHEKEADTKKGDWFSNLGKIALQTTDFKSAKLAPFLCHLSASMTNKQPLPPYLHAPESFLLARQMQKINKELLHVCHLEDPVFSAFISLEVLRSVLAWCMKDLLRNIKLLVGELNFDYHISRMESEFRSESSRLVAGEPSDENGDGDDNNGDKRDNHQ